MNYYGQLDLTRVQEIVDAHPEAFKRVTFKDGKEHILLNIDVRDRREENNGSVAYIRASVKDPKEGISLYLADLRVSKYQPTDEVKKDVSNGQSTGETLSFFR